MLIPKRRRSWTGALVAAAALALALDAPAAGAAAPSFFGNGKGVNLGGAPFVKVDPRGSYQLRQWDPALLAAVKQADLSFIRMVTTPMPLMTDDAAARRRALDWISQLIDSANAAGLAVIVDMHFWSSDVPVSQDTVLPSDPASFDALVRAESELAAMLAAKRGARVALELLNEPNCSTGTWPAAQSRLYAAVRAAAPKVPVVLTACRGRRETLVAFDARPYRSDPNAYWTFHYYEPGMFIGQEELKLVGVPFPPRPELANSVAAMHAMLPVGTALMHPSIVSDLRAYLLQGRGQATIRDAMAPVAAWAKRNGIAANHISDITDVIIIINS